MLCIPTVTEMKASRRQSNAEHSQENTLLGAENLSFRANQKVLIRSSDHIQEETAATEANRQAKFA